MNLYWSVYKNLEKELLKLANVIHFDDNQSDTYSIYIADLLVRTAVEIEALAKELYKNNGGNMSLVDDHGDPRNPFFDSDCIQFLDLKWHITKKIVNVVATNFYFVKDDNRVLRPLKNCNKQGEGRWKKAYQAVKHNRTENLTAGNIGNLIRAMAALYLLNLYNQEVKKNEISAGDVFDLSGGSSLFSVVAFNATSLNMAEHMNDDNIVFTKGRDKQSLLDEAVFIDKYTENSFLEMHKNYKKDTAITNRNISESVELANYLREHPDESNQPLSIICDRCGQELERRNLGIANDAKDISKENQELIKQAGLSMIRKIFSFYYTTTGEKAKRELVLNKMQPIYPNV